MKTSLCMIVRDEEAVLGRCLESVAGLFDEIVIADTGSVDATRDIAKSFTEKVFDFKWEDDFSAARNYAFSKADGDYLMWLDADDVVEGDNRPLLKKTLSGLEKSRPDMVMLRYDVAFDESGRVLLSYRRERIVRANAGFRFCGRVHEAIPPRGKIICGDGAISHRKLRANPPGRNLKIFEKMLSEGEPLDPRMNYYFARELREAGRADGALKYYAECFRDETAWTEIRISALYESYEILMGQNRPEEAEHALFETLKLGAPRADICCAAGESFLRRGDLDSAKFWYHLAPERFGQGGGFVHADYGGYIPYLQLAVIYDRLGNPDLAEKYNSLAGRIRPDSPAVKANEEYFRSLKNRK